MSTADSRHFYGQNEVQDLGPRMERSAGNEVQMLEITAARERRGWSRAELARRAQMSASDVGKIEAGRLRPYPGQLLKLEKALEVPLAAPKVPEPKGPDA